HVTGVQTCALPILDLRQRAELSFETVDRFGPEAADRLDRDVAAAVPVRRLVDGAHRSSADARDDLVAPERLRDGLFSPGFEQGLGAVDGLGEAARRLGGRLRGNRLGTALWFPLVALQCLA